MPDISYCIGQGTLLLRILKQDNVNKYSDLKFEKLYEVLIMGWSESIFIISAYKLIYEFMLLLSDSCFKDGLLS